MTAVGFSAVTVTGTDGLTRRRRCYGRAFSPPYKRFRSIAFDTIYLRVAVCVRMRAYVRMCVQRERCVGTLEITHPRKNVRGDENAGV